MSDQTVFVYEYYRTYIRTYLPGPLYTRTYTTVILQLCTSILCTASINSAKYSMVPMQWCVACVVFCASFGCGRVGLWADDSSRFSKKNKEKMPQPKHIESTGGKGKMPPETLTSAWGPTKKFERSK